MLLEAKEVEFGISIGDHVQEEVWGRLPQPVYVHQIGLARLREAERGRLTSTIEAILADDKDERAWSRLFPEVSLSINGQPLSPGDLVWQIPEQRRFSNWLLRRYSLPSNVAVDIGQNATLRVHYRSIVPASLGCFSFSCPWIVNSASVTATVFGDFEYLVPSHRLIPRANVSFHQSSRGDRREVAFVHNGIMLPGSVVEVNWQSRRSSAPEGRSKARRVRAQGL